ncbi:TolC family protein [Flexibacter flexilis]|nr:TolC family protein [Flexibacter flexilis]
MMKNLKYKMLGLVLLWTVLAGQAKAQEAAKRYSLQECKQMALENNKKIKSAKLEEDAALMAQKSAELNAYPTLDGSVLGLHLGKPLGGAMGGLIPKNMVDGSLTATQPIYVGGKIRYGKEATAKAVAIRQEQKAMTEADVLLEVEKAYWQVIQVQEKLVMANKFKEMLQALRTDLKNAYDAGMIYKNDLLRVEVSLNEAELGITQAQDGLVMSKLNLAQIMGQAGETSFALADSVAGNFTATAQLVEAAANNRPELRLLQKSIEIEEIQNKILQADRLPTFGVSLSGSAAVGKGVNIQDGSNFMKTYYGVASLSIPIFDWGKRASKVKEQSYKVTIQKHQLEQTRELINLEVQNAYLQMRQSVKKIELSSISLQQAEENLKLTQNRFKAGTVVGKDVQEAQAIWQQAYSKLIDAKIDFKINEVSYKKSIGELRPQ